MTLFYVVLYCFLFFIICFYLVLYTVDQCSKPVTGTFFCFQICKWADLSYTDSLLYRMKCIGTLGKSTKKLQIMQIFSVTPFPWAFTPFFPHPPFPKTRNAKMYTVDIIFVYKQQSTSFFQSHCPRKTKTRLSTISRALLAFFRIVAYSCVLCKTKINLFGCKGLLALAQELPPCLQFHANHARSFISHDTFLKALLQVMRPCCLVMISIAANGALH